MKQIEKENVFGIDEVHGKEAAVRAIHDAATMGTMVRNARTSIPDVTVQRHTVVNRNAGLPWGLPAVTHHEAVTDHTQYPAETKIRTSTLPRAVSPYHPLAYPAASPLLTRGLVPRIGGGTVITNARLPAPLPLRDIANVPGQVARVVADSYEDEVAPKAMKKAPKTEEEATATEPEAPKQEAAPAE